MTKTQTFLTGLIVATSVAFAGSSAALAHKNITVFQQKGDVLEVKREKIAKPKTKRHIHPNLSLTRKAKRHGITSYTHRHAGYGFHSHRESGFIDIHPKATKWPSPKPSRVIDFRSDLSIGDAWREPVVDQTPFDVALVVEERVNGVTIIRNVKTFTNSAREVRSKSTIGSSTVLRPTLFLDEAEIDRCLERLRSVSAARSSGTIRANEVRYCQ